MTKDPVVKKSPNVMAEVVVNVLKEDGSPKTPEELENESAAIIADGNTPIVHGSKTASALLLKSLKDEREKRRELEEEIARLKANPDADPSGADAAKIAELETQVSGLNDIIAQKDVVIRYPVMKDKWNEFEEFRNSPDNQGMNLNTAVKAFLTENGLLDPVRPGLEKPTGGEPAAPSQKLTTEQIADLRKNNFKEYMRLVNNGTI